MMKAKLNLAELLKFKDLLDRDEPLAEVLPAIYSQHGARCAGYNINTYWR